MTKAIHKTLAAEHGDGHPTRKLLVASAIGGHLTDLVNLRAAFAGLDVVWVVNDPSPVLGPDDRAYVVSHAERDWRVLLNLGEFARIFLSERPDIMLSAGSGIAIPAALVARWLGIPVVYLEPSSAVHSLSLTGRIMRHLTPHFFVQWPALGRRYPRTTCVGSIFDETCEAASRA